MKTKLEIVLEELEFRKTHPICQRTRYNENVVCLYYYDGNMCAVGRCLSRPQAHKNRIVNVTELLKDYLKKVDSSNPIINSKMFKPEYRGHELLFWENLQQQHDCGYTVKNSLTSTFVKRFKLDESVLKAHNVQIAKY